MTHHLTAGECVDALEGGLPSGRERHLEKCDDCQGKLSELRAVMANVRSSGELPEPSPLFWDHFSDRVRTATFDVIPARQAWWHAGWRPIVAMAGVVAALLLAVALHERAVWPGGNGSVAVSDVPASAASGNEEDSLTFMAHVVSTMSFEELQQATRPTPDATDALVAQLTPEQRAELVRLLKAEGGGAE